MPIKYKLTVLGLVIAAVIAIFVFSDQALFTVTDDEREKAAEVTGNNDESEEVEQIADAQFRPAADPYTDLVSAYQSGKPIVLKFYARW